MYDRSGHAEARTTRIGRARFSSPFSVPIMARTYHSSKEVQEDRIILLVAFLVGVGLAHYIVWLRWNRFTDDAIPFALDADYSTSSSESDLRHTISHARSLPGGKIRAIPAGWNRFDTPWFFPPSNFTLNTVKEARYRILYSPLRHHISDGVGHNMAVMNLEVLAAQRLGLALAHRVSGYGSLTVNDPKAVENFFGWGSNVSVSGHYIQNHVCMPKGREAWAREQHSTRFECNTCGALRPDNKMQMRQIVDLPPQLETKPKYRNSIAWNNDTREFLESNNASYTLFQIGAQTCQTAHSVSNFSHSKSYFWHKYWQQHGRTLVSQNSEYSKIRSTRDGKYGRNISLREDSLNIAVHVRRGDFVHNKDVRKIRQVIDDVVYADLIIQVLLAVQRVGGAFADLPVVISIYSEGKVISSSGYAHDVQGTQDKTYYDINAKPRTVLWWYRLILSRTSIQLPNKKSESKNNGWLVFHDMEAIRKIISKAQIQLRIAEPTLASLHDMIASDVFIGSASGFSANIVWALSRGVSLIPDINPIGSEFSTNASRGNRVCCTVGFQYSTGEADMSIFEKYWTQYVIANEDALPALSNNNMKRYNLRN